MCIISSLNLLISPTFLSVLLEKCTVSTNKNVFHILNLEQRVQLSSHSSIYMYWLQPVFQVPDPQWLGRISPSSSLRRRSFCGLCGALYIYTVPLILLRSSLIYTRNRVIYLYCPFNTSPFFFTLYKEQGYISILSL